jgi:hypothetical protein
VHRRILLLGLTLLAACGGEVVPSPSPIPAITVSPTVPTPPDTPTFTPTLEPVPSPEPEPGTMPTGYGPDDEPAEVPAEALVPTGATVTGQWFAFTDEGVRIVVAWSEAGVDAIRRPRGVAVWRRAEAAPHWRPAFVRRRPGRALITEVLVTTADVTGDRSDDALVFEGTSGSGGCGTWLVVELLTYRPIYRKQLCDGRIEPTPPGEPGLLLTESVYRAGDAHCCPSAIRRTTLAWTGSRWRVTDRIETPT